MTKKQTDNKAMKKYCEIIVAQVQARVQARGSSLEKALHKHDGPSRHSSYSLIAQCSLLRHSLKSYMAFLDGYLKKILKYNDDSHLTEDFILNVKKCDVVIEVVTDYLEYQAVKTDLNDYLIANNIEQQEKNDA